MTEMQMTMTLTRAAWALAFNQTVAAIDVLTRPTRKFLKSAMFGVFALSATSSFGATAAVIAAYETPIRAAMGVA